MGYWQLLAETWNSLERSRTVSSRLVSLTSILGKVMKKILLKTTSTHTENKVTKQSAWIHGKEVTPDQPDSFLDKMAGSLDKMSAETIIYLDFRNAFDIIKTSSCQWHCHWQAVEILTR